MTSDTKDVSESESRTQDKATIQEASRALNIGRKTIYRWLDKGLISRIREGSKTFVLLSEVRAVCDKGTDKDTKDESETVSDTKQDTNTVTVERPHYEGLLIKLGQYEAERRYLLEYKTGLEVKDKELSEARATISKARNELQRLLEIKQEAEQKARELLEQQATLKAKERENKELKAELERLKRPWWRRIFK